MASKSPVWGVEVGQCSLKAIKVQAAGDQQVEMLACDFVEHETPLAQADAEAGALITKSIQTFAQRNDLKGARIAIAVPGQQTLTRFTKMPPVEAKKIPDMVQYEASQQIPFDMDEVVWDYQIFQEKESPEVEVGIFAIRRELIRNYVAYFTDQGVEPIIVQTSPMASYNAAKFEGVQGEGQSVVLLDMGALATDLIVMEGNRIWARPIPIGGNKFTDALVSAFKISFGKAEKLKRTAATSKYARQVFAAMRPIFADLVSEVQRSIGFYTSTHREANITKVLGLGNAFKLSGLQKFLQQNLQLEVDRLSSFKRMNTALGESNAAFGENIASFSVVYGLALQGLGLSGVNSSLLPLEVRKTLLWRKKRPWFAASAACLALGAGALWVGNTLANNEVRKALGESTGVPPFKTAEDAERALSSLSTEGPPGERATKVSAIAKKLADAKTEAERGKKGDAELFKRMGKITENNVFVPRILDLLHRTLAEVARPEVKEVTNGTEYAKLARQLPRPERQEVWIEKLDMTYDARDPAKLFPATTPEKAQAVAKPGWALQIRGVSTYPQLATWLEETLKPALEKYGREPGRGIYVDQVALSKVAAKSEKFTEPTPTFSGGDEAPAGGRGGGRSRFNVGDTGGEEAPSGRRGRGREEAISTPSAAPSGSPGDDVASIRPRIATEDFLTGERTTDDKRFVIYVVVRKGDTPANMIPEVFKPKKTEPEKGKGPEKGAPPKAPNG